MNACINLYNAYRLDNVLGGAGSQRMSFEFFFAKKSIHIDIYNNGLAKNGLFSALVTWRRLAVEKRVICQKFTTPEV